MMEENYRDEVDQQTRFDFGTKLGSCRSRRNLSKLRTKYERENYEGAKSSA